MRIAKGLILGVPALAAFLGVGLYDAGQRATRLQDNAHSTLDLCESLAAQSGGSTQQCITDFRAALDASSSVGMVAALPMALAAAAIVLLAVGGLLYLLRRRRDAAVAP